MPLNVLDAGGGTGVMTELLLNLGHRVTLSDISNEALALAKQKLGNNSNLDIQHIDILSLNLGLGYYFGSKMHKK